MTSFETRARIGLTNQSAMVIEDMTVHEVHIVINETMNF